MDELRAWVAERAAGIALLAVVLLLTLWGRHQRRW